MAFRHHKTRPLFFSPEPVMIDTQVIQFDEDGNQHISYSKVSPESVINSMPSPSEFTIEFSAKAGLLNPVSTSDFEVDNINCSTSNSIVSSLNTDNNENK